MKNKNKFSDQISKAIGTIKECLRKMTAEAIYLGQQPLENADHTISLADRVMPITRMAEMLIADIALLLNPKHDKAEHKVLHIQAKIIEDTLDEKIIEEEKRLNLEGREKSDLLKPGLFCLLWLVSAVALYWGEARFLTDSLQVVATTRADALTYAVGICMALIIISHGVPMFINIYLSKPWIRRISRVFLFLFVVGIFYGLGYWRSKYLHDMGKSAPPPWQFAIFNLGFFIAFYTVAELLLLPYAPALWSACKKFWIRLRKEWFARRKVKAKNSVVIIPENLIQK